MNVENIKKINFFISSKKKRKNIYFIGIGGIGMSGIALILSKLGYKISGSDLSKNFITTKLIKLGIIVYFQHSKTNIKNADFIIKSSAIPSDNEELVAAKKYNIPIFLRAEMLQILMQFKFGIAIAGTHGKTTTTSMIVEIYKKSGLNPTFINGGVINSINTHAQLGTSRDFIVEADESDASFLHLNPKIVILTNIEADHMENYNNDFQKLKKTFLVFLKKIPLYGIAIVCIDDKIICDIITEIKCKIITYGFNKKADIYISQYQQHSFSGYFKLTIQNNTQLNISLNIPGRHNALNAAAAVALAISQGLKHSDILESLKKFKGTHRRFEHLNSFKIKKNIRKNSNVMLINDYGHHPTELSETIKTIRISWPKKNLIMIFQPHRYTRTKFLYDNFVNVLSKVDILLILNVYSANEKFIPGIDSFSLCQDIQKKGKINAILISNHHLILNTIVSRLKGNDIILVQGAGNIDQIIYKIFFKKCNKKKVIK